MSKQFDVKVVMRKSIKVAARWIGALFIFNVVKEKNK